MPVSYWMIYSVGTLLSSLLKPLKEGSVMDDEENPNFYRKKDIQPQDQLEETRTADQLPPSDLDLTVMMVS